MGSRTAQDSSSRSLAWGAFEGMQRRYYNTIFEELSSQEPVASNYAEHAGVKLECLLTENQVGLKL